MAVRSIATAAAVQRHVADITRSVRAGRLAPGSSFSVRDAAEQLQTSWPALRAQLSGLEHDGLLAISDRGIATVAPLDAAEITSLMRLARLTRPALHARAAARRTRSQNRRLTEQFAVIAQHPPFATDTAWRQTARHALNQLRAAASRVELDFHATISAAAERYVRLAWAEAWRDPGTAHACTVQGRQIGAELDFSDPDSVRRYETRSLRYTESVIRSALRLVPSDAAG